MWPERLTAEAAVLRNGLCRRKEFIMHTLTKSELTEYNVGCNLDSLMNLDPRGYGVCRILYAGARKFTGEPISTHAAKGLIANIKKGEKVFILTGFVLHPWNEAETDGIISSCVFARFLMRAFGAKPVMIVPEQCKKAIKAISNVLYFKTTDDIDNIEDNTVCIVEFTKKDDEAEAQCDEILSHSKPCAVVSIEAPGRNKNGYYHNAVGVNTSDLEAKFDILFMRCQKLGIFNLSIGDLGNEIGMAAIEDHIRKYVPYAELGGCKAGTGFGILASSAADNIESLPVPSFLCRAGKSPCGKPFDGAAGCGILVSSDRGGTVWAI